MILPYDKTNPRSIEAYAKKLLHKSLRSVLGNSIENKRKGKGGFGEFVEEVYFHYAPNQISQPDFPEAGVELKTTPLKQIGRGLVSKERLVFNMIDFNKEYLRTFQESSFWKKNHLLLLMFYLYEKDKIDIDYIFKIIRLWRFPAEDLKIIKDDWNKIIQKIKAGNAHEISESDTLYLGACTKGASKNSTRTQPFSLIPAMSRAFSLKQKYVNFIIQESIFREEILEDESEYENVLREPETLAAEPYGTYSKKQLLDIEAIVKNVSEYNNGETFEELVIRKFKPFCGKSEKELLKELDIKFSSIPKNKFEVIARRIMGVKKKKIEEFEKADVLMKTIRIELNGTLKESMSFKQIQFREIINEEWEESVWFEELSRRFFFVIFQADTNGNYRLKKVMFWSIPQKDLDILEAVWTDTKEKIRYNNFENFIKASDKKIGHVRPKAKDSNDLMETLNGTLQKKKSFWLNNNYIKSIIQ